MLISFITISLSGQKKSEIKISEKIKSTLSALCPDVMNVKWSRDKNKTEAVFNYKGKNISVTFTGEKFFLMKTQISSSEIPKAIKQSLHEYYNGYKIINVDLIRDSKDGLYYGLELMKTTVMIKVVFDQNGRLIKNTTRPN